MIVSLPTPDGPEMITSIGFGGSASEAAGVRSTAPDTPGGVTAEVASAGRLRKFVLMPASSRPERRTQPTRPSCRRSHPRQDGPRLDRAGPPARIRAPREPAPSLG